MCCACCSSRLHLQVHALLLQSESLLTRPLHHPDLHMRLRFAAAGLLAACWEGPHQVCLMDRLKAGCPGLHSAQDSAEHLPLCALHAACFNSGCRAHDQAPDMRAMVTASSPACHSCWPACLLGYRAAVPAWSWPACTAVKCAAAASASAASHRLAWCACCQVSCAPRRLVD